MTKKKILIIEDDADVRLGYNVLLRAHGYETFFAADSAAAISEARKNMPDVILLDLGLPGGDGFLVLNRLRLSTYLALIPVIVVSARDAQGNRKRALDAGARSYLQKPWDDNELLTTIGGIVGQPVSPSVPVD